MKQLEAIVVEAQALLEPSDPEGHEDPNAQIAKLSPEEIKENFWFTSLGEDAYPHNYPAYCASLAEQRFGDMRDAIDRRLTSISDTAGSLLERRQPIVSGGEPCVVVAAQVYDWVFARSESYIGSSRSLRHLKIGALPSF